MGAARTFRPEPETGDSGPDSCLIKGRTACLRANANALATLDQMVRDGIRAFPKRGLEVGGLLTGQETEGEIHLDTVLPLPMEYRSSPSFQPSPSDLLFIKQSVVQTQASETRILGHFRSQTSGTPGPNAVDRNIASLLNLNEALLVLIPASVAGVEPARLYRAVNGEWTFLLSFPLTEPSLVESTPEVAVPVPLEFQATATRDRLAGVSSRSRWYRWALAGLAVGVAGGAYVGHSLWNGRPAIVIPTRPNPNDANSDVHLELHPSGPALTVQWNPASSPVVKGISGMLTVHDGGRQLQIPLDRNQLETGHTVYYPESGWVEVRLEIEQAGNHFIGQTVAMATGVSPTPAPAETENPTSKSNSAGAPAKKTRQPRKASPKPALRRYRELLDPLAALPTGPLPSAPQIALAMSAPVALPPPEPPSAPVAIHAPAAHYETSIPVRYETAVPIRKVRPSVPEELHSILPEATSVVIRVQIDAVGRVVSASPSGNLTATQKLLAPQAVEAARLWRFQPARKNGEAVESESLLRFDFEREGR